MEFLSYVIVWRGLVMETGLPLTVPDRWKIAVQNWGQSHTGLEEFPSEPRTSSTTES